MSDDKKSDAYEVGYGKPPKSGQFKPGQSGNPRGRPMKPPTMAEVLDRQLSREVMVSTPNGPQKMPVLEVLVAGQVKKAAAGDTRAMKVLLEAAERHGVGMRAQTAEVNPEDEKLLAKMLADISRGQASGGANGGC